MNRWQTKLRDSITMITRSLKCNILMSVRTCFWFVCLSRSLLFYPKFLKNIIRTASARLHETSGLGKFILNNCLSSYLHISDHIYHSEPECVIKINFLNASAGFCMRDIIYHIILEFLVSTSNNVTMFLACISYVFIF